MFTLSLGSFGAFLIFELVYRKRLVVGQNGQKVWPLVVRI